VIHTNTEPSKQSPIKFIGFQELQSGKRQKERKKEKKEIQNLILPISISLLLVVEMLLVSVVTL
jgi:hypothetical protein